MTYPTFLCEVSQCRRSCLCDKSWQVWPFQEITPQYSPSVLPHPTCHFILSTCLYHPPTPGPRLWEPQGQGRAKSYNAQHTGKHSTQVEVKAALRGTSQYSG